ncbi:RxLR effector protein [Phytophthora ramorum]|uniref:RxLR effector protein n=1 Tax=Phytophthora ramorum TaxID=164328 RepID=UPI0030B514DC|nr:RxLR effector protein [Phytophthora ramorum]
MRLHHIGVLAVAALLASVDVVSSTISSKIKAHNFEAVARPLADNRNDVLPTRLLRTNDLLNQDTEERLYGLEKASEAINSAASKIKMNLNIRTWVKEGKNADNVFNLLQLDGRLDHVLSSKNFKYWSKFIDAYNTKNLDSRVSMIDLLTARFGEAGVSKMLISAKKVKGTEELATKLQSAQVAGWINKGETPGRVFRILELRDPRNNPLASRNLEAFTNYLGVYNHRTGKETTLFQVFSTEKKLVEWLQTSRLKFGAATKGDELEAALFTKWFKEKLPPKVVMGALGISRSDDLNLYVPLLNRYHEFHTEELAKVRNAVP